MLPDVTQEDWNGYQADQFSTGVDRKIGALEFSTAADQRIGSLVPDAGATAPSMPVQAPSAPPAPAPSETPASAPSGGMTPDSPVLNLEQLPTYAPDAPLSTPSAASPASAAALPRSSAAAAPSDLVVQALQAADDAGVDPGLYAQVIQQESSWNPRAQSPAGAQGLSQLMPDTARGLGVTDPFDVGQNLKAGARYLRQQIDRFGGDVVKGLAAYNAGAGNVEKYGGVPPFAETQRYVDNIMSAVAQNQGGVGPGEPSQGGPALVPEAGQPARPSKDISQFGDPQLTTDEAYAACGPAAAVRFAQRFGRNPTQAEADALRQTLDLAKSNQLWDASNGMHGLASEKALLDKMNVPNKLIQGPQWQQFAAEAQTGNPVIISTDDHYFTADGYDPTSGKFHVGQSGLDLKGGAEWMSPADMQRLMGAVQGGLLADNPQVPAPSTADQGSPNWWDRTKDAIGSTVGNAVSSVFGGGQQQPQDQTEQTQAPVTPFEKHIAETQVGTGSDALTNPPIVNAPPPVGQQPQPTIFDTIGQTLQTGERQQQIAQGQQNLQQDMQGDTTGLGTAAMVNSNVTRTEQRADVAQGQALANQVIGIAKSAGWQPTSQQEKFAYDTLSQVTPMNVLVSVAGAGEGLSARALVEGLTGLGLSAVGSTGAINAAGDANLPEGVRTAAGLVGAVAAPVIGHTVIGGVRGLATSPAVREFATSEEGALKLPGGNPAPTQPAYQSVMPAGTFEATPTPPVSTVDALNAVRTSIVRAFTDRQVDINQVQRAYAKALGRPLNADEMAAELQRLSADPAAQVLVDEGLKPAVQTVGNDYNALRDYVTLRSNVQVAEGVGQRVATSSGNVAKGADAALNRKFSGGLTRDESQTRLQQLEEQLGPDRFATVEQAANQVSDFSRQLRQRLIDSGVLTQDQADQMERLYPDWAKTRVLDYMKDPAGGQGAGTKIGLSDRNVREYSVAGTEKAREDPLASTVAYAHQVEQMARKNEAFNAFLNMDQASPAPQLRKVAPDFTPTKNQVTIVGFVDGEKVKYVTDNKALGEAINGAGVMSTPGWTSAWSRFIRAAATSRNPLFLAGNAALDIPTYVMRTSVREGGPLALGRVFTELAKGYADAFQGIFQGEYRGGSTAAFLKSGGGQSGFFTGAEGAAAQTVADLRRSNVFQINGKADVLRLAKDLLTLKPVEGIGERIELGPRVAAYRLAQQRGANAVQAAIEGRTVTIDFSQGGTFTKYVNNFIPFFNVGFQGPAQLARAFRENPNAFVATTGALIGLPSAAVEIWNHADPQRWKDYQDVPDYVKNQGVVIMLPGDTSSDAQGNRKPGYALVKLREWAPFAQVARSAVDVALGDNQRSWQEMAQSIGTGLSPTNSTSISQVGAEPLAGIPVLPAALQLQQNRDFFRNRDIVTNRNDQNASALAKSLTPAFQRAVDAVGLSAEVRPSAVDFFIRDQLAGIGSAVSGASDLAAGTARKDTSAQSLPVVGGLAGRFGGTQTGQGLQSARDAGLAPSAREILRSNGITATPGGVSSTIEGVPLKLDEEARYQQLFNRYVDDAIHRVPQASDWGQLSQKGRQARMQGAMDDARTKAGVEALRSIDVAEKQRRRGAGSTAPSAVGAAR